MKKLGILIIAVSLLLSLFSCSGKGEYSDSVPCAEILDSVEEQLPINLGYESFDAEHVKYYFDDTKAFDDKALRYSVLSEDINEFGVFHAPDEKSRDELEALIKKYFAELLETRRAFITSYAPKELTKLEHAEVKVFGNYVAYAILDSDDRETFFETVSSCLKK